MHKSITFIKKTCGRITFTKDGHDKTGGEVLIYLPFYINVSLRTGSNRVIYLEERHGSFYISLKYVTLLLQFSSDTLST